MPAVRPRLLGALCAALCVAVTGSERVDAAGLTQREQLVVDSVAADAPWTIGLLETLVDINSGSENLAGVEDVAGVCATQLRPLGFAVEAAPGGRIAVLHCPTNAEADRVTAPHVVARRTGARGKRLLLSAHLDTVFEPDSGFLNSIRTGDRMVGPGVVDCKGGITVMITALRALHSAGELDDKTITIVLNSDEELGSLTSRDLLEAEAARHDVALVFEGGQRRPEGATVTTERKGLGQFQVVVEGRAAHAGVHHKHGVNALEELAGHILAIQRLTDYARGTTLNVGTVDCPGCKRNIVPACAEAEVDLRYTDPAEGERVQAVLSSLAGQPKVTAADDGTPTRTRADGVLHRPPWRPTPESQALSDLVLRAADDLGMRIIPVGSGGGSDANLIGTAGCPAVDGLGPVGGGFHTHEEWVEVRSITARAQLAAVLMMRVLALDQPAETLAPDPVTPLP